MKSLPLLIATLFLSIPSWCQPKAADISAVFSSKYDADYKFSNGKNMETFSYYFFKDTLFYTHGLKRVMPLKWIDLGNYVIEEDDKLVNDQNKKVFNLTLHAVKSKKFYYDIFKDDSWGLNVEKESLSFPTRSVALQAFNYLKTAASATVTENRESANEKLLHQVLANKEDDDFEFNTSSLSSVPFKYYYHNDSLWFYGTNPYATVIPVNAIDFGRTIYYLESSLWKTKTGEKCIEVPLYAIKGKLYKQEFDIEQFEKHFGGQKIDFANLILPNKVFAEELIKFLKAQRR